MSDALCAPDFLRAAAPWALMGPGPAPATACFGNKRGKWPEKSERYPDFFRKTLANSFGFDYNS